MLRRRERSTSPTRARVCPPAARLAAPFSCALVLAHLACAPPAEAPTSPTRADPDASPSAPRRTANHDRRTFDNQPDYDGEAAALRGYVDVRLADIKAEDPAVACAAMLDAAAAFYAAVELEEQQRAALLAALAATRERDHEACVRETSLEAAACVLLLLGDRSAELPWLLDQCSRAYPRP